MVGCIPGVDSGTGWNRHTPNVGKKTYTLWYIMMFWVTIRWCTGYVKKNGHSIYWLMVSNMCLLSILYGIILPINYYFFRGVKTTNQYLDLIVQWQSMASIWNFSFVAGPDTRAWGKHQHPKSGATLPCDRRAVYKQLRDWYSEATWAQQAGTNCWSDGKI